MSKYYAFKGEENLIFDSWDKISEYMVGKKGYTYKSFSSLKEAEAYLNGESYYDDEIKKALSEGYAVAYTDGSYEETINGYSYGVVAVSPNNEMQKFSGFGNLDGFLPSRNIAGETWGALIAVKWAYYNGYQKLKIYHDYAGLSFWAEKKWSAKSPVSEWYVREISKYLSAVDVEFVKVKGHSNDKYNEEADKLAKSALLYGEELPLKPVDRGFKIRGEYYSELADRFNKEAIGAKFEYNRTGITFTYGEEILNVFPLGDYAVVSGNGGYLYCLAVSVACKIYGSDLRNISLIINEAFDFDVYLVGDKARIGVEISEKLIEGTQVENYAPYLIFALHGLECEIRKILNLSDTQRISAYFKSDGEKFSLTKECDQKEKAEKIYEFFYKNRISYYRKSVSDKEAEKFIGTAESLF